jgi:hypothetical protein
MDCWLFFAHGSDVFFCEIERMNVKEALIFPERILIHPPERVDLGDLELLIEPFEEKRLEYEKKVEESSAEVLRILVTLLP